MSGEHARIEWTFVSEAPAAFVVPSEPAKEIAKTPEPEKTEALELRKSTN